MILYEIVTNGIGQNSFCCFYFFKQKQNFLVWSDVRVSVSDFMGLCTAVGSLRKKKKLHDRVWLPPSSWTRPSSFNIYQWTLKEWTEMIHICRKTKLNQTFQKRTFSSSSNKLSIEERRTLTNLMTSLKSYCELTFSLRPFPAKC